MRYELESLILEGEEKIYGQVIDVIKRSRERYGSSICWSVILDKESVRNESEREWFSGEVPDWITYCGIMRLKGYSKVIEEIEWLESKIHAVVLERNLMLSFNEGDKEGIELCLKTMNGIIGKAKLTIGKGDSDRKGAEALIRMRREASELEKYDTKELEAMLDKVNEIEGGEDE